MNVLPTKYTICFGIDDSYVWPFLVAINSAKMNWRELKTVTLAYDPNQLSKSSRLLINSFAKKIRLKIKFLKVENTISEIHLPKHLTRAAFIRLNLPNTIRGNILWLDSDVLLLSGWSQIIDQYNLSNEKCELLSARKHWETHEGTYSNRNQAVIMSNNEYFNSGVLLINSKKFRKEKLHKLIKKTVERYEELGFQWADQCVLNYVFQGAYNYLASWYNSEPKEFTYNQTRILHFAGDQKPWHHTLSKELRLVKNSAMKEKKSILPSEVSAYSIYAAMEIATIKIFESVSKH